MRPMHFKRRQHLAALWVEQQHDRHRYDQDAQDFLSFAPSKCILVFLFSGRQRLEDLRVHSGKLDDGGSEAVPWPDRRELAHDRLGD